MIFKELTLSELTIDDERSFRHVALYDDLKQALKRSGYRFRVPSADSPHARWDRVLFLNLTFWNAAEAGDVLVSDHIAADIVAHVAWHHLTRRALLDAAAQAGKPAQVTAEGLFLGEAIASAFDLYLVGRLIGHSPDSEFLETQVPAMAEAAEAAGLSEEGFEAMLDEVASDPERAFEDLRQLLFDAASSLVRCEGVTEAALALERLSSQRFAPLLHHYELSNWILYARAYAPAALGEDPAARALDAALRGAKVSLDWLTESWVRGERLP